MSKDGFFAIVTGSASGLGAATAAILAKGGGRIVVNYSNSAKEAEATADICRKAGAEVWKEIHQFFADLKSRSIDVREPARA